MPTPRGSSWPRYQAQISCIVGRFFTSESLGMSHVYIINIYKCLYIWPLMQTTDSLERPWFWESLKTERKGQRGWAGWMASPIQWTRTWANSRRWWGTGRSGVLQSMRSRRVRHNLATETHTQKYVYSFSFYLDCWFAEICLEAIMDYAITCTQCKWR